ncbi:glycoside hydrolase family 28 protein [Flammeovirgaceae bacterium SG7u.111]|nr:glycoside hydrolase family 28 protein [Flammeovirgaceae bacterium SG7u.132]WPO33747.1 glycoside hydrolase family 28 protein [Flammeovirgaceae bacterium SG7u.111]
MKLKKFTTLFLWGIIILFSYTNSFAQETYNWEHLPTIQEPDFKSDTSNILDFGAKPDGITLNTEQINKAIADCSKKGGGVVLVPSGYWITGPIKMQSNVNLHLAKNAFLQFTKDFDQYKMVEGVYEGKPSARNESPIMGTQLENIAITGFGTIDGNGDVWRMVKKDKLTESEWKKKVASGGLLSEDGKTWFPSEKTKKAHEGNRTSVMEAGMKLSDFEDIKDYLRPNMLVLTECKKVLLEGVTFQNSPAWNLHPLICEDLTLRNLFIKNPDYAQNGDGIDIESCKNVLIEGCTIDVGDDAICIKSGKDKPGRDRGVPTENVIVRNNIVYKGHGGFVVGSEMSGGAKNIFVSNCSFMGTDKGLRFKTTRGRGGVVENIYIKDINMVDIVHEAVMFNMYYWTKTPGSNEKMTIPPVTEETPQFKDIYIENIVCNGAERGICIKGIPEMPVQNINMKNIFITTEKGVEITYAQGVSLQNATIHTKDKSPLIYIESSEKVVVDNLAFGKGIDTVFEINGESTKGIQLLNTDLHKEIKKATFQHEATKQALLK